MDANRGPIPHPERGIHCQSVAGSYDLVEKPIAKLPYSCRPAVSSPVFSTMLALLETLRNLVVSGHEPASYLVSVFPNGGLRLTLDGVRASAEASQSFTLSARPIAAGYSLAVEDVTGRGGYRVEQFCRSLPGGRLVALPHGWARCANLRTGEISCKFATYSGCGMMTLCSPA
jgi:hypothetical protein